MADGFAFSLDRETFRGNYPTREAGLNAAMQAAAQSDAAGGVVYVGKLLPAEPGTNDLGEVVVNELRRRAQSAGQPIRRASESQLAELDDAIENIVRGWLARHEMTSTSSRVVSISEHPVPQTYMAGLRAG